ncbi:MAG: DUF3857 domain-containing protein [bacterium]
MRRRVQSSLLAAAAVLVLGGCHVFVEPPAGSPWTKRVNRQGADREVLLREVRIRVDAQGRVERSVRERQRVLTDRGADVHCDPRTTYDRRRQAFTVRTAETRMRSGARVRTPPSGVNTVTPRSLALAPAYSDITDTVVSLLGIEPGAVTELHTRLTDHRAGAQPFGGVEPVGDVGPMQRLVISVELPAGRTLRHECVRCPAVRAVVRRSAAGLSYTWTFGRLPSVNLYETVRGAGRAAPSTRALPRLVYSVATDWRAALGPLAAAFRAATELSPSLQALAHRLGKGKKTPAERLQAAARFVSRSLVSVRLDALRHGLLPAAAAAVARRGYGHRLDKSALLLALLRALKVPAKPVLVGGQYGFSPRVPAVAQLDRLWIEARTDEGTVWVDPLHGKILPQGAGGAGLHAATLDPLAAPVIVGPGPIASSKLAVAVLIGADGTAKVSGAVSLEGAANAYGHLVGQEQTALAGARNNLPRAVWKQAGKKSRVDSFRPGLLRSRFTLRAQGRLSREEPALSVLQLPDACGILDRISVLRARPTFPLRLPAAVLSCRLALSVSYAAAAFAPVLRPGQVTVKTRVGSFRRLVQAGPGRLNIVVEAVVRGPTISPAQVPELRRLLVAARAEGARLVVFRQLKSKPRPKQKNPAPVAAVPKR